jgi:Cdc6-like AAA superfamily ATPase
MQMTAEHAPTTTTRSYRLAVINQSYSPGSPISESDLFAGRLTQIARGVDAVFQRGTHAIIFGERGVGKTSLANCLISFLPRPSTPGEAALFTGVRVNCVGESTYESIWREVFSKLSLSARLNRLGFGDGGTSESMNFADALPEHFGPAEVQHLLTAASADKHPIIAIDEFDKVRDSNTKTLMADTIKALSDHGVDATVILVGIGDTVEQLIAQHESVARCLREIVMPRMTFDEARTVAFRGVQKYNERCPDFPLEIEYEAASIIATLALGMPHYAHLLAQQACVKAIQRDRQQVTKADVLDGLKPAISTVEHYVLSKYVRATRSSHAKALYRDVLTAAALTPTDPLGFFPPSEVRKPLSTILNREIEMANYIKHLNEFCGAKRGAVLQREGEAWKFRYRFDDPMMVPFVVIQALGDKLVSLDMLRPT